MDRKRFRYSGVDTAIPDPVRKELRYIHGLLIFLRAWRLTGLRHNALTYTARQRVRRSEIRIHHKLLTCVFSRKVCTGVPDACGYYDGICRNQCLLYDEFGSPIENELSTGMWCILLDIKVYLIDSAIV